MAPKTLDNNFCVQSYEAAMRLLGYGSPGPAWPRLLSSRTVWQAVTEVMFASGWEYNDYCLQELWKTRSRPKALDVDAIAPRSSQQANGLAGSHVPEAGVQPSACRSLGLSDQHKQWSLEENTKVEAKPGVWGGQLQGQWQ